MHTMGACIITNLEYTLFVALVRAVTAAMMIPGERSPRLILPPKLIFRQEVFNVSLAAKGVSSLDEGVPPASVP